MHPLCALVMVCTSSRLPFDESHTRMVRSLVEMKRLGYDLNTIAARVCEIYKVEKEDIYSRSRQKMKSDARALFCFWAVRELGYGQRELARILGMTQPGVGYAVTKGEVISKSNNYQIKN